MGYGVARQGGRVELWSGKMGYGEAVQVWTDELSHGLVCSGQARRSSYGVFRSVKARPVEAVQVCWGLVSWVTAYQGMAVELS